MGDDPVPLRDLLDDSGRRSGISQARETGRLWRRWREIAGEEIADHAEPTSLRDGVLRLRVSSPAWGTEISYLASEIRARVNETLGAEIATDVRVWTALPGDRSEAPAARRGPRPDEPSGAAVPDLPADPAEALARARRAWAAARREGR